MLFQPTRAAQRASCETKERYASEAEARSIALMNAAPGRPAATRPYRCDICGAELRMTLANDEQPEPPRHCMEEMVLLARHDV